MRLVSPSSFPRARVRLLVAAGFVAALPGITAVGDLAASGATASSPAYRLVIGSNRDGVNRAYSLAADGSQLSPLLAPTRRLFPYAVSANGRSVAYVTEEGPDPVGPIFVSGGSGTGLRRLDRDAFGPAISPNGRLLAYMKPGDSLWIVGANGRGRKRLARKCLCSHDWSPSGNALVYDNWILDADDEAVSYSIVVHPLRGKRRVIVRANVQDGGGESAEGDVGGPQWSPKGRWIAYNDVSDERRDGLWVVRPNGTGLHRIGRGARVLAWAPDGKRLAVTTSSPGVSIVGVSGSVKRLRIGMSVSAVAWSPDGRSLFVSGGAPEEVWTVGIDGQGLRRLTSVGRNQLVGLTTAAPARPSAPPIAPSERVADARTVELAAPVADLSADGGRVAFLVERTKTDCHHPVVWAPGRTSIERFELQAPCWDLWRGLKDVELAGTRVAWLSYGSVSFPVEYALSAATLTEHVPRRVASKGLEKGQVWDPHLRGDGDLLVFNDASRLVRIGVGKQRCHKEGGSVNCTILKTGAHASAVDWVSGELIAVRERQAVAVLDVRGNVKRVLPFSPGGVNAARLDGDHLVVWRFGRLESYDVSTGALEASRPFEAGYRLVDVDGGVAVLVREGSILLLRLADGASRTLAPASGRLSAELEPDGLYYAYRVGSGGRLVFVPRSEVLR
jgi:Tol biopolymer transport system component